MFKKNLRLTLKFTLIILLVFSFFQCNKKNNNKTHVSTESKSNIIISSSTKKVFNLKSEKKKFKINENLFISYELIGKIKMGTKILKISLYNAKNELQTNYNIFVSMDMPEMRGHHKIPEKSMIVNKNNYFLAPLDFVMYGLWEITLKIFNNSNSLEKYDIIIYVNI